MPVKVPESLPAIKRLQDENIFVMTESRALTQEIRPLKIAILNLMPNKQDTEVQLLRLIGNTPLQVEVVLLRTASYDAKHTDADYLNSFYHTFDEVIERGDKFDGLVITGAPVETLDFKEVAYWGELKRIMEWAKHNVYSVFHICWAAQAGMYFHYGIDKRALAKKVSGVYKHTLLNRSNPIVRGFDDVFYAPHSRYTVSDEDAIFKCDKLDVLAVSEEAGVYLCISKDGRNVFAFGHGEYDCETLANEYERDQKAGKDTPPPAHYFVDGKLPPLTWRAHESLLFANWLNYCVYQSTPYIIESIG